MSQAPISQIAHWIGDEVEAADFPKTILRFRNYRAAKSVGLDSLSDEDWVRHFGRFAPLEGNLERPLALRYHGHQFRQYNPEIGDGRGFLFAQLRADDGRLLDLGTKGSGTTPHSRFGDGRLTLKGGVREILATEMLEALGVNTSKTFSLIETGEELTRGDEPSPTRSSVMVRLSHSHIRIGTFQRLYVLGLRDEMAELTDYCLTHYPGGEPPANAPGKGEPAAILLHQMVERLAKLAASYMAAGFVHGVLNTDNINITGESFDYGPWRFLPQWNPAFTAAYFDHQGLYAFGRQPEAIQWNLGQMALSLRLICDAPPLIHALERFGTLYEEALAEKWCWRLGFAPRSLDENRNLIAACEEEMRASLISPDMFFHTYRAGRNTHGALAAAMSPFQAICEEGSYWQRQTCESLVVDKVENIWNAITQYDDWEPLYAKISAIHSFRNALKPAPSAESW